jgi:hypothetical protein
MEMLKSLFVLIIVLLTVVTTAAQSDKITIRYGEVFTGELTNERYEIPNVFAGNEGDVIIIEMKPVDTLGDLSEPVLILVDSAGSAIADTSDGYSYGSAMIAAELPADDTYTVLATRIDGAAGTSVGEFTLSITQPTPVEPGTAASGEISSDEGTIYYLVESIGEPSLLSYQKNGGDYNVEIRINEISETSGLSPVVTLSGSDLTAGQMNLPEDEGIYIVTVGPIPFDFTMGELTAEFELEIIAAEG